MKLIIKCKCGSEINTKLPLVFPEEISCKCGIKYTIFIKPKEVTDIFKKDLGFEVFTDPVSEVSIRREYDNQHK